ncbi:T9SS type A sorting domain-containing protein [Flavobacterium jejuense]|uniref:T9SS type A sorting domain-containing protein n=1 Tax=Flavobacterium jejuense TaxID=1544455 RepID=A0ABX0J0B0_9FLAO|nr:T9SS type A sorting domain-containing protein [Flavobacterium jejuense]NHN27390.1 T9SS type A sorting domain-containing protein [Flavobacterium jejuense]
MKTRLLVLIALFSTLAYSQTFDWETATLGGSSQNPNSVAIQTINGYEASFRTSNNTLINLTNAGQGSTGLSVRNAQYEQTVLLTFYPAVDIQSLKVFGSLTSNWTFKSMDGYGSTTVLNTTTANVTTAASIVALNWTNVVQIQISRTDGDSENFGIDDIVYTPYTAPPCIVNIPDANFKAALVANTAINTNGNTEIECTEASAFTGTIDVNNINISDLTGIEAFTEITELRCNGNNLSALDVSQNTKLTLLNVASNQLIALDLSTNLNLQTLWAQVNQFTSLDVSANTNLTLISVGSCPNLVSLNVANGNNSNIPGANFAANSNPNLTCITVDNVAYSTANWNFIDAQTSFSTNCASCVVNIPDANFKAYLVANTAINTNGNTEIECSEASAFTGTINCSYLGISDLTGIEAFVNLTYLYCIDNQLSSLDVSQNTSLISLLCFSNQLSSLDVGQNTSLTQLRCYYNQLSSLDVSQNTSLIDLWCSYNQLSSLDLSQNTSLEVLYCNDNQLTSLDVSQNTALSELTLDSNQFTSLNVANGNNSNITYFTAISNPNLTCIQVDDVAYSTTNWTNIDAQTSFSTNCAPCVVNIPDVNFKAYLVANTAINTNGNTEIECTEASAFTGQIDCNSLSISDLTGIEAFLNLTGLRCSSNQLSSLDVSQNTSLLYLECESNQLSSLDVSQNTSLTDLRCATNPLSSLDVTQNTSLTVLHCYSNQLSSLDVTQNTSLIDLLCSTNQLSSLDVSQNTSLTDLVCGGNQLSILDVSQNTSLTDLNCANNQLSSLDVSQNSSLTKLFCVSNQLSSLDVSQNSSLTVLYCQSNPLSSLDVQNGNNINITSNNFYASSNPNLTCIQVDDVAYSTTNWTNIDAQTSFSTNCALSSQSFTSGLAFSVYPNPTRNVLNIEMKTNLKQATIYSVLGTQVLQTKSTVINTANLNTGMYLITIEDDNGFVSTKRFIKQ